MARPAREAILRYSFADTGPVMSALEAAGVLRLKERYGEQAELRVAIPLADWDAVLRRLRDETGGRIAIEEGAATMVAGG
jgi:putative IMPACT (imprinted ancient) family translation regulator